MHIWPPLHLPVSAKMGSSPTLLPDPSKKEKPSSISWNILPGALHPYTGPLLCSAGCAVLNSKAPSSPSPKQKAFPQQSAHSCPALWVAKAATVRQKTTLSRHYTLNMCYKFRFSWLHSSLGLGPDKKRSAGGDSLQSPPHSPPQVPHAGKLRTIPPSHRKEFS